MSKKVDQLLKTIEEGKEFILAVLIHLNDTYLIEERPDQNLPGFPRVIATIRRIRDHVNRVFGEDRTLVLHSGDFLGPSRVGTITKGRVMLELLNRLGLDWCVLGNHEFDYGESTLIDQMKTANFGITIANMKPAAMDIAAHVLWPSPDRPLVALTGIVSPTVKESFPKDWKYTEPAEALAKFNETTVSVPFHVVLSHGTRNEDREIRPNSQGRTIVLGGHDHDIDWVEDDGTEIMKNLSNLKTVRVILLVAGGGTAVMDLMAAHDTLYNDRCEREGVLPRLSIRDRREGNDPAALQFPDDCEEVLAKVHPKDAEIFRNVWASISPQKFRSESPYSLEKAVANLPTYHDWHWVVLRYEDHEPADTASQSIVDSILSSIPDTDIVVRDATAECPRGLDAREESLRYGPTEFGHFVAECVRLEAQADLALLNAGSFRSDTMLPPTLRNCDLFDCFLYDKEQSVVALDIPRSAAIAMLEHGWTRTGSGGFPQVAPLNVPEADPLRVAIASYLLEDEKTIDGYDDVLARALGIEKADLPSYINARAIKRLAIIPSVLTQASVAEIVQVEPASVAVETADKFIELVDAFIAIAKQNHVTDFLPILSTDDSIPDPELLKSRNRIRTWIRGLPEVSAAESSIRNLLCLPIQQPIQIPEREQKAINLSINRIRELYTSLEGHAARFRANTLYHKLLEYAATGIGGWYA